MFLAAVGFPLKSTLQFWGGEAEKRLGAARLIPFTLWVGSARPAKLACLTSDLG